MYHTWSIWEKEMFHFEMAIRTCGHSPGRLSLPARSGAKRPSRRFKRWDQTPTVKLQAGWWFWDMFIFPYIGKKSVPTDDIFQRGRLNHQPVSIEGFHNHTLPYRITSVGCSRVCPNIHQNHICTIQM